MQTADNTGCWRLHDVNNYQELAGIASHCHKWKPLSEKCPSDMQKRISEWESQDQNRNRVRHEIQLIRSIQTRLFKEAAVAQSASVSQCVAAVNLASPVEVANSAMHSMAAYVLAVGANHPSIERVCQYHAHNVNPT